MFRYGDRIEWRYRHYLNSRSSLVKIKRGEFLGLCKHTRRYEGVQLAYVKFDGNKGRSKVPVSELRATEPAIGVETHGDGKASAP